MGIRPMPPMPLIIMVGAMDLLRLYREVILFTLREIQGPVNSVSRMVLAVRWKPMWLLLGPPIPLRLRPMLPIRDVVTQIPGWWKSFPILRWAYHPINLVLMGV